MARSLPEFGTETKGLMAGALFGDSLGFQTWLGLFHSGDHATIVSSHWGQTLWLGVQGLGWGGIIVVAAIFVFVSHILVRI